MSGMLRLYITGCSLASQHATINLRRLCENELAGAYDFEIIDILENPELAEQDKILATPTLVRRFPAPSRKVIGDLSQTDKVLFGLGFDPIKLAQRMESVLKKGVSEEDVGK